jgi:hypothetical protein
MGGFEAVYGRAEDALEVVHRGWLEALGPTPIDGPVQPMAGLRIER